MLDSLRQALLALPRTAKRTSALAIDVSLCALAVRLAFYLRLEIWYGWELAQGRALTGSIVLAIPVFIMAGLYREIFRHGGGRLLTRVGVACAIYGFLYAMIFAVWKLPGVPRSIGLLQPLLLWCLTTLSRLAVSGLLGRSYAIARRRGGERRRVAVYGAGSAGRQLLHALERSQMQVVAFIDDDEKIRGQVLLGRKVAGPAEIQRLIDRDKITDILLALPSASRRRRNEIIDGLRHLHVNVRTLPGLNELADGKVTINELRSLDVDDLLGRDPVDPDAALLEKSIRGKIVLVTGAGGSIGSELCRQIVFAGPKTLLLVDHSELALYSIHTELDLHVQKAGSDMVLVPLLASTTDKGRMRSILDAWRPSTVYHAAAYKHVPLVEFNPAQGVWNNAFGTLVTARAAIFAEVSDFVLISSDKAVRPTNVMGATKRLAELCLQALCETTNSTRFSMVRFGNVLGSSGSVVPKFREQIRLGGPITITHPDVNRFFMTISEASQLVIQAGAMAKGGEVFVLDMGEPVMIVDLARRIVELSGLSLLDRNNPLGDIALEFVGLRPGEKLHEELLIGNDPSPTHHRRIMKAHEHFLPWAELESRLFELEQAIRDNEIVDLLRVLGSLVPEYKPALRVHDLVFRQNGKK